MNGPSGAEGGTRGKEALRVRAEPGERPTGPRREEGASLRPCGGAGRLGCDGPGVRAARALRGGTWRATREPALFPGFYNHGLEAFPVQTSERAAAPHLPRDLGRRRAIASPRARRTAFLSRPRRRAPGPALDPAESRRCQPPSCDLRATAQRAREVPSGSFLLLRGPRSVSPRLAPCFVMGLLPWRP